MKIWIGNESGANRRNMFQLTPEDAVRKLKDRRPGNGSVLERLGHIGWFSWLGIRLFAKGVIALVLAGVLDALFGHKYWLAYGVLVAWILLLVGGALEVMKRYGISLKLKEKKGIGIGKSVRHYADTGKPHGPEEVGADEAYYIDYMGQPNHHVLINGSTSSGKTATMRSLIARASLANNLKFLMIDWNGENEKWGKDIGATVWKVPLNFKVNLFKLNGLSKEDRAALAIESLEVAALLTPLQATKVRSELLKSYSSGSEPSLYDLWKALCTNQNSKNINNVLNQRLRAIQRVIGYEPREFWEGIFTRNNIISLAGLNESEKTLAVYAIMQRLAELFDKEPEIGKTLKLMVVIDETWEFFKREREFDRYRASSLEKVVRLGRKYGFGLVVSTQQIEDVPKVFVNSCSLMMLHQQRDVKYYGDNVLNLDKFELAYLKAAAQGEMLLIDRGQAQKGQMWNDYVTVGQLTGSEMAALLAKSAPYAPKTIAEPQMPIEMYDGQVDSQANKEENNGIFKDLDIPSVSVYRFLLALRTGDNATNAYRILKERGWITSLSTLYGGKASPSILARAINSGYVNQEGKFTEKGLNVINPERMIAKQGIYAGSEEHKDLMRKTIKLIQDRGNFAFTLGNKDSFDVGEIKSKMKRVWNYEELISYECQTNAINEEVQKAVGKAERYAAELAFVVGSEEVRQRIKELVGDKYVVTLC